jgi:hypothetical protein
MTYRDFTIYDMIVRNAGFYPEQEAMGTRDIL